MPKPKVLVVSVDLEQYPDDSPEYSKLLEQIRQQVISEKYTHVELKIAAKQQYFDFDHPEKNEALSRYEKFSETLSTYLRNVTIEFSAGNKQPVVYSFDKSLVADYYNKNQSGDTFGVAKERNRNPNVTSPTCPIDTSYVAPVCVHMQEAAEKYPNAVIHVQFYGKLNQNSPFKNFFEKHENFIPKKVTLKLPVNNNMFEILIPNENASAKSKSTSELIRDMFKNVNAKAGEECDVAKTYTLSKKQVKSAIKKENIPIPTGTNVVEKKPQVIKKTRFDSTVTDNEQRSMENSSQQAANLLQPPKAPSNNILGICIEQNDYRYLGSESEADKQKAKVLIESIANKIKENQYKEIVFSIAFTPQNQSILNTIAKEIFALKNTIASLEKPELVADANLKLLKNTGLWNTIKANLRTDEEKITPADVIPILVQLIQDKESEFLQAHRHAQSESTAIYEFLTQELTERKVTFRTATIINPIQNHERSFLENATDAFKKNDSLTETVSLDIVYASDDQEKIKTAKKKFDDKKIENLYLENLSTEESKFVKLSRAKDSSSHSQDSELIISENTRALRNPQKIWVLSIDLENFDLKNQSAFVTETKKIAKEYQYTDVILRNASKNQSYNDTDDKKYDALDQILSESFRGSTDIKYHTEKKLVSACFDSSKPVIGKEGKQEEHKNNLQYDDDSYATQLYAHMQETKVDYPKATNITVTLLAENAKPETLQDLRQFFSNKSSLIPKGVELNLTDDKGPIKGKDWNKNDPLEAPEKTIQHIREANKKTHLNKLLVVLIKQKDYEQFNNTTSITLSLIKEKIANEIIKYGYTDVSFMVAGAPKALSDLIATNLGKKVKNEVKRKNSLFDIHIQTEGVLPKQDSKKSFFENAVKKVEDERKARQESEKQESKDNQFQYEYGIFYIDDDLDSLKHAETTAKQLNHALTINNICLDHFYSYDSKEPEKAFQEKSISASPAAKKPSSDDIPISAPSRRTKKVLSVLIEQSDYTAFLKNENTPAIDALVTNIFDKIKYEGYTDVEFVVAYTSRTQSQLDEIAVSGELAAKNYKKLNRLCDDEKTNGDKIAAFFKKKLSEKITEQNEIQRANILTEMGKLIENIAQWHNDKTSQEFSSQINNLYKIIPNTLHKLIEKALQTEKPSLLGRFKKAWFSRIEPKFLLAILQKIKTDIENEPNALVVNIADKSTIPVLNLRRSFFENAVDAVVIEKNEQEIICDHSIFYISNKLDEGLYEAKKTFEHPNYISPTHDESPIIDINLNHFSTEKSFKADQKFTSEGKFYSTKAPYHIKADRNSGIKKILTGIGILLSIPFVFFIPVVGQFIGPVYAVGCLFAGSSYLLDGIFEIRYASDEKKKAAGKIYRDVSGTNTEGKDNERAPDSPSASTSNELPDVHSSVIKLESSKENNEQEDEGIGIAPLFKELRH